MQIFNFFSEKSLSDIMTLLAVIAVILLIISNSVRISKYENNQNVPTCSQPKKSEQLNIVTIDAPVQSTQQIQSVQSPQNSILSKPELTVSLFYTDWCGYSRQFLPEWEKLASTKFTKYVNFEKFECDQSQNICTANEITGYPTIKFTKSDGTSFRLPNNVARNAPSITNFIEQL